MVFLSNYGKKTWIVSLVTECAQNIVNGSMLQPLVCNVQELSGWLIVEIRIASIR